MGAGRLLLYIYLGYIAIIYSNIEKNFVFIHANYTIDSLQMKIYCV